MHDAICLGSITLDLFFSDDSLTISHNRFNLALGGKYVVSKFSDGIGGGGANIAIGLSRAGLRCALWSQIGKGGLSLYLIDQLEREGVDTSMLNEKEAFANLSVILLSPKGERTILTHRSHEFEVALSSGLKKTRLLFIGNMPEVSLETRQNAIETVREGGGRVALNFGVKDCRRGLQELHPLFSLADYIIMNRYELADVLGVTGRDIDLAEVNYHKRLKLRSSSVMIVTDGSFGSYAHTKDSIVHHMAKKVSVVDTTGAGDAYTTGFLAGILHNYSLAESMEAGSKNAASVVGYVTAQKGLLTRSELFSAPQ